MMTLRHVLFAAVAVLVAGAAHAQSTQSPQTATFTVSASVAKVCAISAANIALGAYDPITANATNAATGSVTVQCTKNTPYDVKLDDGANASGGARRMKHASQSEYLSYELYSDSGHQTAWNSTTFVSGKVSSRTAVTIPVYAFIPAAQDVPEGSYTDTVTATIEF